MTRMIEMQSLLGKRVVDVNDRVAGRIATILAERAGPQCEVLEYQLGTAALLTRLGITTGHLIGFTSKSKRRTRVPWQLLDLADPERPRLRCTKEELEALQATLDGDGESEVA